ncbi:putative hydroxypyruvate isomerase isoform X1 [Cricetulus griseus]|uniref:Putative hydroxypyruvate isomerase n=2 Tax=Cricetulus griseus TaxID=10029 RepID=A0A9J7F9V6_CRIGR|nr:putative hydroxypyruvate isomerase isoform X1 [Cricetulus griseus]XP_027254853.1 putative hydroxypyruvate isomerase isoform X2 [Cricetulus griseus]ERE85104.1 putative hydroxypyruvate isomerase-like protein [Cricetulus griseus]
MAPLRFSANVSWLFPELPGLPERLQAAGRAGFEAAEVAWPYAEPPQALASAARAAGLRLVLINTPRGNQEKGEMGLGAVPGRQAAFREGLEQAVLYAKALGCPRIHLMAGRVPQGADRAAIQGEMETVFLENLKYAAGVLAQENLVGLLEPINTRITDPQYFLDTPQQAAAILQKVGRPNLQLQMDIFHWQIMGGNLTANIREFLPIVGHVQVAQVPDRGEPGSSGELDFSYLFQLLEDEGYQGFVGCEYRPRGDTVEGLSWLRSYWDRRGHPQTGQ